MAKIHLKDLPKDGVSGDWGLSVTPKGYVTSEIFLKILNDLDIFLSKKNILHPVILLIDGATPTSALLWLGSANLRRFSHGF